MRIFLLVAATIHMICAIVYFVKTTELRRLVTLSKRNIEILEKELARRKRERLNG